ncbi:hypothetical protein D3C87_616460 [compost metagenome]
MSIVIPFENKLNQQFDSIVVEHTHGIKDIAKSIADLFKDEVNFIADMSSFTQYKPHNELPNELKSIWIDKVSVIKNAPEDQQPKSEKIAVAYLSMMEMARKRGVVSHPNLEDVTIIASEHFYGSSKCIPTIENVIKSLAESRISVDGLMVEVNREINTRLKNEIISLDKSTIENTVPEVWKDVIFDRKKEAKNENELSI